MEYHFYPEYIFGIILVTVTKMILPLSVKYSDQAIEIAEAELVRSQITHI